MIKVMLDTNICIYILKEQSPAILEHLEEYQAGEIAISFVVYAELIYGVHKSSRKMDNLEKVETLVGGVSILPLDQEVAYHYGLLRSELEAKGNLIGPNDLFIAAHALTLRLPLATNNIKEFSRVPGLSVLDWQRDVSPLPIN